MADIDLAPAVHMPAPLVLDLEWFDYSAVDRDNLAYHLEKTPAWHGQLGMMLAEAEYNMRLFEECARDQEARTYVRYKSEPWKRRVTKGGAREVLVDASDEFAHEVARADVTALRLRNCGRAWRRRRDELRGWERAMETKRSFLASLAGIFRSEMDMQSTQK